MDGLNVITLEQAKDYLEVDFEEKNDFIETCIKSAVAWVERYTCYFLYQRDVVYPVIGHETVIRQYPLADIQYKDKAGTVQIAEVKESTLKTIVYTPCYNSGTISVKAGYAEADIANIPEPLISAAYKLIAYLYENHSAYASTLPVDVQLLLNQFRRSATI